MVPKGKRRRTDIMEINVTVIIGVRRKSAGAVRKCKLQGGLHRKQIFQ